MRRMTLFQVSGVLLSRKEQEQNFIKYGKITSRDAGVFLRPSNLKVLLLYQLKWQLKKNQQNIGSFRTFRFFNKPLSGITRLDLIWSLQEPVVPNVICIFLSVHLFVLSVFPLCLPVKTACPQLRALGERPATKYRKKKNLGSRSAVAGLRRPAVPGEWASGFGVACSLWRWRQKGFCHPWIWLCLLAVPGCWRTASLKCWALLKVKKYCAVVII